MSGLTRDSEEDGILYGQGYASVGWQHNLQQYVRSPRGTCEVSTGRTG
jgi:hypothetical protein